MGILKISGGNDGNKWILRSGKEKKAWFKKHAKSYTRLTDPKSIGPQEWYNMFKTTEPNPDGDPTQI